MRLYLLVFAYFNYNLQSFGFSFVCFFQIENYTDIVISQVATMLEKKRHKQTVNGRIDSIGQTRDYR